MWLAPISGGLIAYKDGAFTWYGPDDGLADPIVCLAEAPDGTIYAASAVRARRSPREAAEPEPIE